jgi:tetratricopeptide (TPR) repeat protein
MITTGISAKGCRLLFLLLWSYTWLAQSQATMKQINDSFSLIFSNPEEALQVLNRLETVTGKQQDSLYAIVLNNKGVYHATQNDLDKAIYYFEKAAANKACNAVRRVKIKNNLAVIYKKKGLYAKSFDLFKAAENLAQDINNNELLALIYGEKASLYSAVDAYEEAAAHYLKSIELFENLEQPNTDKIGIEQQKLGNVYVKMNQLEFALELFTKSEDALKVGKRQDAYGLVLTSKAEVYLLMQRPEKALKVLTAAQHILLPFNNAEWSCYVYEMLARYYLQTNQWDLAETYFELSLQLSSAHNIPRALHTFTLWAEAAYVNQHWDKLSWLYNTYNKQFNAWLLRAGLANKKTFYELDAKYNQHLKYFDRSNTSLNQAIRLNDSLQNLNNQNSILNLQWKYQTREKERENLILKQALTLEQRLKWIGVLSTMLLLLIVYVIRKNAVNQKQLKIKELEQLQYQIQLAASEIEQSRKLDELKQAALKERESNLLAQTLENIQLREQLDDISRILALEDKHLASKKLNTLKKQRVSWSGFLEKFMTVNPDFNKRLLDINDQLSVSEVELCAMIRLNMNTKDIARIFRIRPESVFTKRYRLMKKLNLPKDTDLHVWLNNL